VRRAQPTLGETFVVIGLGIIGQLTAQILRADGCRVIGVDLDADRVQLARQLGMDLDLGPDPDADVDQVARLTDGIGADGVIITAATRSNAVVSSAFRMCRKKGRVVLVGDVGLDLDRSDFYAKEIDFLISSSYGPGRYDRAYEERGLDYPVGYVRWTENRNMGEYLRLLADGRLDAAPLIGTRFPVGEAPAAYAALQQGGRRPIAALLEYPQDDGGAEVRVLPNPRAAPSRAGTVGVGLIGAGSFAKGMHLPNLRELGDRYQLRAVASRTGHNATATAERFGARYSTTEPERLLDDPEIDLVLVATRHDLHARLALAALRRGKHVLVEKPLALTREEVEEIRAHFEASEAGPILLTGFNRRFSPHTRRIAELTSRRAGPLLMTYRMNAGYLPLDHWTQTAEGGGRNRGEACHIYDLFTYLTGSRVADVQALSARPATGHYSPADNFVATMRFEDGSVGTLAYTALGAAEHPKEQLEVFVDGRVLILDDYRTLRVAGARDRGTSTPKADKGHRAMLVALAEAIRDGGDWPIPLWQQLQATEIALAVEPHLTAAG
jgi:predicted dehydrogenase